MLYVFIGALLVIGAKSQCNVLLATCQAQGQGCIDVAGLGSTCGCDTVADCDTVFLKSQFEQFGDVQIGCEDTLGVGYNVCAPKSCSSSTECDAGVDCFGNICVTLDTGTSAPGCDESVCAASGLKCVDYSFLGETGQTCGCTQESDCDLLDLATGSDYTCQDTGIGYNFCFTDRTTTIAPIVTNTALPTTTFACTSDQECVTRTGGILPTCALGLGFCYPGCDSVADCDAIIALLGISGNPTCEENDSLDRIKMCVCLDCTTPEPFTTALRAGPDTTTTTEGTTKEATTTEATTTLDTTSTTEAMPDAETTLGSTEDMDIDPEETDPEEEDIDPEESNPSSAPQFTIFIGMIIMFIANLL